MSTASRENLAQPGALTEGATTPNPGIEDLESARRRFERGYVRALLADTKHNISKAARIAGLTRQGFYRLLRRHGISPRPRPMAVAKPDAATPDRSGTA